MLNERKLASVLIKFTAPNNDEIPARWREKIVKSTLIPECPNVLLKGG